MLKRLDKSKKQPAAKAEKAERLTGSDLLATIAKTAKIAVKEAIAMHHAAGDPVTIERDGKLVHLMPDGSIQPIKKPRRKTRAA